MIVLLMLAATVSGCQDEIEPAASPGFLSKNLGYVRAAHTPHSKLTIFDADTFDIYRTVELPPATLDLSHRLEMDPAGRIWLGYSQVGLDRPFINPLFGAGDRIGEDRVLILSPGGDVEHELDLDCSPLDTGIAFANGYSFVGCAASGFSGKVIVVDTDTLEVIKTFDRVHPGDGAPTRRWFYINVVARVANSILVIGGGNPPKDYQRLTNHSAVTTRVGVIDADTLTFRGYLTGLEPGLRVRSVLEVDGKAWLFNELSHMEERPPRTDVYVMDPETLEIVESFNLEHPFPLWAEWADDKTIYIYHKRRDTRDFSYVSGITRLDPATGVESFFPTPNLSFVHGMGVYRDRPCLAHQRLEGSGLWCMDDDGVMRLKIPHEAANGVLFASPIPGR